jgi:hypothetical protein
VWHEFDGGIADLPASTSTVEHFFQRMSYSRRSGESVWLVSAC